MTPEQYLADQAILDAIDQQRLAASLTADANHELDAMRDALLLLLLGAAVSKVAKALRDRKAQDTILLAYKRVGEMVDAGQIGAVFSSKTKSDLEKAFPGIVISTAKPAPADEPVIGHAPSAWWRRQAENIVFGFKGLTMAPADQVAARLDALTRTGANQAKTLINTLTTAAAASGRLRLYQANVGALKGFRQISILDSRTSEICRDYAGCTWDLNLEPTGKHKRDYEQGCPRHANCRSVIVPLVGADFTNTQIPGAVGGQDVSADTTFAQWFESQSEDVQRDVLGKARLAHYRAGTLTLAQLLDMRDRPLTLEQLKAKYARAS